MAEAEETVGVEQAREAVAGGDAKALDIRDEEEWSGAQEPGAIHIPAEKLESGIDDLDLDSEQRLVVFASDQSAGKEAVSALREKGFEASLVKGGVEKWSSEDFRLQPTEDPDPED
jgi:rhodanese-related sulfurtransferase